MAAIDVVARPAGVSPKTVSHVLNGDAPMPREEVLEHLPGAAFYVAARPTLSASEAVRAPKLRAVIEVSGAFHEELDDSACFEHGIEAVSCSPGFRHSVAEMAVAMMLGGGRGLVAEHEAFRAGQERWCGSAAWSRRCRRRTPAGCSAQS